MIFLSISTLVLMFVATKAFSESIHCYECDDCKKSSNKTQLRACPEETLITSPPDNLIPETTTMPAPTTLAVPDPDPVPKSITTTPPIITEPPETTTIAAPAQEPITTIPPVLSTAGEVAESNDNDENAEKVRKRSVRNVSYRSLMVRRFARETEVNHHCYSIKGYGGDKNKIKKGCVKVVGNKRACDVLKEQYNVSAENCVVCKGNKCNNSGIRNFDTILYPVFVLLIILLEKII